MAKTSTICTLSPTLLVVGYEVFFEDARSVEEMLNWAIDKRPVVHASMSCGADGWGGGNELRTLNLLFAATSGWKQRLYFKIVVAPETKNITVGARCFIGGSGTDEGQVRFTVGAASPVTVSAFTDADNGAEHTATVATSDSGTGELDVVIEINHTVGARTDNFLRDFRVEEQPIGATNLPDPADA